MKNWKWLLITFGIFFNVFMYEALSLESNNVLKFSYDSVGMVNNQTNNLIILPYYGNILENFSNFSQLLDSMTTNVGSSLPMTNECRWECDSEYIIKMLKRDGKLSEHIKKLIKDGEVCEVLGHKWEYGCSKGPGCLVYHSEQIRHCSLCLKEERQISVWK